MQTTSPPTLRTSRQSAFNVVHLLRVTRKHLREHGLAPTALKVVDWIGRRVLNHKSVPIPAGGFESCVEFDPAKIASFGPIHSRRAVVQEIPLHFDELHSVEVLLATFARRNRSTTEFTLLTPDGRVLGSSVLPSARVLGNAFARVALAAPVDVSAYERIFLVIRSADGTASNSIAAWTSTASRGRLWIREGAPSPEALIPAQLGAASPLGSLIYRLTARNRIAEPRYRWPTVPQSAVAGRPLRLALLGTTPYRFDASAACFGLAEEALAALRKNDIDVAVLVDVAWSDGVAHFLREASHQSIPTAYLASAGSLEVRPFALADDARAATLRDPNSEVFHRRKTLVACDFVIAADAATALAARADRKPVLELSRLDQRRLAPILLDEYRRLRSPRVSIVTILYNKARELPAVLASYERQSYRGEIELVFVDDCSPDASVDTARAFEVRTQAGDGRARFDIKFVRNEVNSGNCFSRNCGISAASGDLLIIVDADCMLNRDFVKRHVDAHAFSDCEVVVGPLNIETGEEDPAAVLHRFENDPSLVMAHGDLQDRVNRASFLNCVTRNLSIKRTALPAGGALFDPAFSYSADPSSGFGWEDVEMGFRLYESGARIKFVAEAFSIHVSEPLGPEGNKPARSLLNFRRLLEKHPDLLLVSPEWVHATYRRIVEWAARAKVDIEEQRTGIDSIVGRPPPTRRSIVVRSGRPRLRVLTYRWHVAHQYELWKLPIDVTLVTGTGSGISDRWDYGQRPLPANARFRRLDEINPRDYDLGILHFDENVLAPENCNGVIGPDWGAAFRLFREQIDLPKIAICHGTPQFHGQYNFDYVGADLLRPIETERQRLVDYLGDIHVVCNSYQAQAEWQFRRSSVIWHGFDPAEFPPATYERGILSPVGPLVLSRPHYRGYFLYRQVFDGHYDELRPETLRVPEPHPSYVANAHAIAKFRRYVDELRRYSVYFNPTLRSPMPRARGEPMMCGVVTVSANNHDVDRFIENGVDGFYADSADELRSQLKFLVGDPGATRRIGAAARAKAMNLFHVERYLTQWRQLIAQSV